MFLVAGASRAPSSAVARHPEVVRQRDHGFGRDASMPPNGSDAQSRHGVPHDAAEMGWFVPVDNWRRFLFFACNPDCRTVFTIHEQRQEQGL